MYKNLTIASVLGIIAVILGAFGAHALKSKLSVEAMQSFETAVRYQFLHVLLLLFVNSFKEFNLKQKNTISLFLIGGIILFSGSIYMYLLTWCTSKINLVYNSFRRCFINYRLVFNDFSVC